MDIINLTSKKVVIAVYGSQDWVLPANEKPARLEMKSKGGWVDLCGAIPVLQPDIMGLPAPKKDTLYFVDVEVMSVVRGRSDVVTGLVGVGGEVTALVASADVVHAGGSLKTQKEVREYDKQHKAPKAKKAKKSKCQGCPGQFSL
jgi:hypothetical protein